MGHPTHDKVMWKRSGVRLEDAEARLQDSRDPPGPGRASTPKPESVCLTILCLSPTLLTLTGGCPDHLSLESVNLGLQLINLLGMKGVFQTLLAFQLTWQVYPDSCNIVEPMLAAKFPHSLSTVFLGVHRVRMQKKQVVALALATLNFELISSSLL